MMKKKMPFLPALVISVVILLTLTGLSAPAAGAGSPSLTGETETVILKPGSTRASVQGRELVMQVSPYVEKGITMIPLRFFAQYVLGARVEWEHSTRTVSIYDVNQVVTVHLKHGQAVLKNGYTYVPLRLLAEMFDCAVSYNETEGTVTITVPKRPETLPVARFELPDTLTSGQPLSYRETSFDPLGHTITERVWEITTEGRTIRTTDPISAMSRPFPGIYTFRLRVKNSLDRWSDWASQSLVVLPNKPPVIVDFISDKTEAAIGEKIHFSYHIQNEEWEEIVETRWTHSWLDENEQPQVRRGKPRAFFKEGPHRVTLQVKDEYGHWSQKAETEIIITDEVHKSEKAFKFGVPIPGELFFNHENANYSAAPNARILSVHNEDITLIASNNPERVYSSGILYQDSATGAVRLRYHHRSMAGEEMRIAAVAENTGDAPVEVEIINRGQAGPSADVMQVGQQVVVSYLKGLHGVPGVPVKRIILQPGERVLLNENQRALRSYEVVSGLIDLYCSGELLFTIVAVDDNRSITSYRELPVLPRDSSHIRGTFGQASIDLHVHIDGKETEKVVIGRNDAYAGYFLTGIDSTTGETVINNGNRGVLHTITVSAGEKVGVLLNPRGTIFRGALALDGDICLLSNCGEIAGNRTSVVLGVLEEGETKTITYLTPSGSDSPVLLLFVPEAEC